LDNPSLTAISCIDDFRRERARKDLSAGSGIVFHDRGKQVLKGMPDEWQLFAVV